MRHSMKLCKQPFERIKSGSKTIELRLNDEKRQLLGIGDEIDFICCDNGEAISTRVLNIYHFDNFSQLYKSLPLEKCGYSHSEIHTASSKDMLMYYSEEKQNKYGVLGIEIELII